jgi:hypothetical protein
VRRKLIADPQGAPSPVAASRPPPEPTIRQAVVVIHGMGEHRPLDTLNNFIAAGMPPVEGLELKEQYYSRPDEITDSFEERRYLAPRQPTRPTRKRPERYAQTEFFEYHWAHLMQGNRLLDLLPAMLRLLLRLPNTVPSGLRVVWGAIWIAIGIAVWAFTLGPLNQFESSDFPFGAAARLVLGTGLVATAVTFLLVEVLGGWATSSFVDVIRYLDTSPRSYAVRHDIRKGIIDQLQELHGSGRYKRIIIVAHSLGSYIAYDAITFLWGTMNTRHAGRPGPTTGTEVPVGLVDLERAASDLAEGWDDNRHSLPDAEQLQVFRDAQRALWQGIRQNGNPWLISDLITFGSPMYFADRLYTRTYDQFRQRVEATEFPTCPPVSEREDYNNIHDTRRFYSYEDPGRRYRRRVLHHGAPFAVVRWTNLWFPAHLSFFGDWFGGPLAPLYGAGIKDIRLRNNGFWPRFWSLFPAVAHARYFSYPNDNSLNSATSQLRGTMELASSDWLSAFELPRRRQRPPSRQAPRAPATTTSVAAPVESDDTAADSEDVL